jgi:hypothetical protein
MSIGAISGIKTRRTWRHLDASTKPVVEAQL